MGTDTMSDSLCFVWFHEHVTSLVLPCTSCIFQFLTVPYSFVAGACEFARARGAYARQPAAEPWTAAAAAGIAAHSVGCWPCRAECTYGWQAFIPSSTWTAASATLSAAAATTAAGATAAALPGALWPRCRREAAAAAAASWHGQPAAAATAAPPAQATHGTVWQPYQQWVHQT